MTRKDPHPLAKMIRALAKSAHDPRYYDRARRLQRFYSGMYDPMKELDAQPLGSVSLPEQCGGFWAEYSDSDLASASIGQHSSAQIASRVMVQQLVYSSPDVVVNLAGPITRAINQAWVKRRWQMGSWSGKFLEMGMTGYEPCGLAFAQVGVSEIAGKYYVDLVAISPLDVIWDPVNRNPADWEWFIVRKRYSKAKFFHRWSKILGMERCTEIWDSHKRSGSTSVGRMYPAGLGMDSAQGGAGPEIIYEFEFWSQERHMVCLGHIEHGETLTWEDNTEYSGYAPAKDDDPAVNPLGVCPVVPWWDNFSAASNKPIGKGESVFSVVAQANRLEHRMNQIVENAVPLNIVSTYAMTDKSFLEHVQKGGNLATWGKPILTSHPKASESISRVPGADISSTHMAALSRMDALIAGVTGTSDAQRGQFAARPGERVSAFEVKLQAQASSVQQRHMANRLADFLSRAMATARVIGAKYETLGDPLTVDGLEFPGDMFPASEFLAEPALVFVSEDSLMALGTDAKRRSAIEELSTLHAPFMVAVNPATGAPVIDPVAVYRRIAEMYGIPDPDSLLMAPPPAGPAGPTSPGPEFAGMMNEMSHNSGSGEAINVDEQ